MVIGQLTTVITAIQHFLFSDRHRTIRIDPITKKSHSTDDIFSHVLVDEEAVLKLKDDGYLKDH
jgi:hypothetical protein